MSFLFNVLNAIFSPVMAFGPLWTIVIVSLLVSFVFSLINRLMINPEDMKHIKEKVKQLQQLTKEARSEGKDKKVKELFEKNMEYSNRMMKLQMKPLLVSMLFVLFILPWLGANYGDVQIPLKDNAATHQTKFETVQLSVNPEGKTILFASPLVAQVQDGGKVTFRGRDWPVDYVPEKNKVVLENIKFTMPVGIPLLASDGIIGWLGMYILISISSTILFRKLLGVD